MGHDGDGALWFYSGLVVVNINTCPRLRQLQNIEINWTNGMSQKLAHCQKASSRPAQNNETNVKSHNRARLRDQRAGGERHSPTPSVDSKGSANPVHIRQKVQQQRRRRWSKDPS